MSAANAAAIVAFMAVVAIGLVALVVSAMLRQRPRGRMRARLQDVTQGAVQGAAADASGSARDARRRQFRQSMGRFGRYADRVETVAGSRGLAIWVGGTLVLLLVSAAVAWLLLPLEWWGKLLVVAAVTAGGNAAIYRRLNARFSRAFLEQLPDVLDMIIRASQAGVPVTQAIRSVGEEFPAPVGPEFRRMGDSLFLGNDMTMVLDEAEARVRVPDFSFLSVCLLLQRETGGSLSETLSNLATVIRARRDLRLKTRALTAEGRFAGGMISAIPFLILGTLSLINPEYISVLFETEAGQDLLMLAAGMMLAGILSIRKIANMET